MCSRGIRRTTLAALFVAVLSATQYRALAIGGGAIAASTADYTFTTFVGAARGSTNGPGSAARFNHPSGVAVNSTGTVYVADTDNHTIRKITVAGVVTTLAGTAGSAGSTNGLGSAARFDSPKSVGLDSDGNVYVADTGNSTIRKITPQGLVTTLAGTAGSSGSVDGTGSAARFNSPSGVVSSTGGNVYVADTGNCTIRKITPSGVVTTVAGTAGLCGNANGTGSAARFFFPSGIDVFDLTLYVADTGSNTIRKITPDGVVTTLAGFAFAVGSTDGTGSAARFNNPTSVAVNSNLVVYVADSGNHTIRRITEGGAVTTLAGTAGEVGSANGNGQAARFESPSGVTVGDGTVYVADYGNSTIRRVTSAGSTTTLAGAKSAGNADGKGGTGRFSGPQGVALNAGTVYVADSGNHTIRKVTATGVVSTLAGTADNPGSANGTGSTARFNSPTGVAVNSAGIVYVADSGNHTIRRITAAGVVSTLAGTSGTPGSANGTGSTARFNIPTGIAVDSAGTIFVADAGNHTIRQVTAAGAVTTLAGVAGVSGSADGTGTSARFDGPTGVAVDGAGIVYVADSGNSTIRKITAAGVVTTLAGSPGIQGSADGTRDAARFEGPDGVAVDRRGTVFVADTDNDTIRKVTPAGVVTTIGGVANDPGSADGKGKAARFDDPTGIAINAAGILYIGDKDNNTIRKGFPRVPPSSGPDVDGDGKADLVVFRRSSGTWFIVNSTTDFATNAIRQWGLNGDVPVPGDYDGDGVTDVAVYRPTIGVWYILKSSTSSTVMVQTGTSSAQTQAVGPSSDLPAPGDSDLPVPGDYDGDGKTDVAVYRRSTGVWSILISSTNSTNPLTFQWGLRGDIPVANDYDGDGATDLAVYRPSTGTWYVLESSSDLTTSLVLQWGARGDVPVPGDYDADGIADLAVYRPATGEWHLLQSTTGLTTAVTFQWGLGGDIPVPGDYDGDGTTDFAVYRPSEGTWYLLQSTTDYDDAASVSFQWGLGDDVPVPNAPIANAMKLTLASLVQASDFDGDGTSDITVYRPSTGTWFNLRSSTGFTNATVFTLGASTDLLVPGDFDGDGQTDGGVYTSATGIWSIRRSTLGSTTYQWGLNGDAPVPGDYDGDGKSDLAVYRPASGTWFVRPSSTNFIASVQFQWGLSGDVTAAGDYDGDGVTDLTVYRPSTGTWYILQSTSAYATSMTFQWGLAGDITVPGDYDGDSRTDVAVYRPSTGTWFIRQSSAGYATSVSFQWGLAGDIPVPGDFDGDGKTDVAVHRPSTGTWFLLNSTTNFRTSTSVQWGLSGDIPILWRPGP